MSDNITVRVATSQNEPTMKGWLFKWTNYLKGYQRRWFVLQNGHLSYYRAENSGGGHTLSIRRRRRFRHGNQAEMAHTCRGSISLHGALIYTVDACTFVISNGGTQTFHIRAASEVERQSWVTALELVKAKAIRTMESEEDEEEAEDGSGSVEEWSNVVRKLETQLNDLQTCSDLIAKHWRSLMKPLGEMETNADAEAIQAKAKEVCERATLYRISTNAMINACAEYLKTAQTHGLKWIRLLKHEREQTQRLQDMVETLAQQHSNLEQVNIANSHKKRTNVKCGENDGDEEDENEFFDALPESGGCGSFTLNIPKTKTSHRRTNSDSSSEPDEIQGERKIIVGISSTSVNNKSSSVRRKMMDNLSEKSKLSNETNLSFNQQIQSTSSTFTLNIDNKTILCADGKRRRMYVPEKPNYPLNLWSIMKNCIGKDLSKIPMPVNFSEPLSMLQRLAEDFEYAELLDAAAGCTDPYEQLAYVTAFTITAYSTTSTRTAKPFNPLLGETYELDRINDLGWRLISEQVSHHPPVAAQYCESKKYKWRCWQEFTMSSKFRGKYLQVIPLGKAYVEFIESGNRYSWNKVTTTVHNIIVGKLWVDQHGDTEIIGQNGQVNGIKCLVKYIPYSYFNKDSQRRVKGYVMDNCENCKWIVDGTWDDKVEIAPVIKCLGTSTNPIYETGDSKLVWQRRLPPPYSDKCYNFTIFAAQLNEIEDDVAPTDSRLRPDQRLMENGYWDEANAEKVRLEEKQRTVRLCRESEAEAAVAEGRSYQQYEPLWFEQKKLDNTDEIIHIYKGNYWECKEKQDWSMCPKIF